MVILREVRQEERRKLWNIFQKFLYEMTNYYDDVMDEEGNYHYGCFDSYFEEPDRHAFFLLEGETLVGFAMVNRHSYLGQTPDHVLAEFTIFPMYRGRGLAAQGAKALFEKFPGSWEVKFNEKNTAAKALWQKVTAPYGPTATPYSDIETVLTFCYPTSR